MPAGSSLARLRVVLSHTSHPGNIGAAARAMKTMGLSRLVLVAPRRFPDPEATALASGADDLLERAAVCATLDEALAGTRFAIALTARRRMLTHRSLDARAAGALALSEAQHGEVALVFGTEMSGLSNEEVIRCQRVAHISADPEHPSLNLAQAVQILAYEVRMAAVGGAALGSSAFPRATFEDIERFYEHLERSVVASGFLDPAQPKRFMERMRRLFGRAGLEREEVNILRGMLTAWDEAGRRK